MPIFEYACPGCGHTVARICLLKERDTQKCDECETDLTLLDSVPARRTTGFAGKGGGLPATWGREP